MTNAKYESLVTQIKICVQCDLSKTRKQAVPGEGSLNSKIMFIGEAPGASEDAEGKPFVGPAGKVLNKMLQSIGLTREQVYITNIVKCRPPNNRDPNPQEIDRCWKYLEEQMSIIDPETYTDVYNDYYLKRYATALIKQQWGQNLLKFEGMTMPGGITFNGRQIYDDAREEIKELIEEVRLNWEQPVDFYTG